jgi:hypothetical protein
VAVPLRPLLIQRLSLFGEHEAAVEALEKTAPEDLATIGWIASTEWPVRATVRTREEGTRKEGDLSTFTGDARLSPAIHR